MSERLVNIASKLYAARDAMRFLHGSNYTQKVADTRPIIEVVMRGAGCDELVAGIQLAEAAANRGYDGVALMVLATVVEMVEPAAATNQPDLLDHEGNNLQVGASPE